jgi:hypothetical protein
MIVGLGPPSIATLGPASGGSSRRAPHRGGVPKAGFQRHGIRVIRARPASRQMTAVHFDRELVDAAR